MKHDLRMRSVFDDLCAKAHAKPKVMLETGDLATCLALTDEKVGPTLVTNTLARLFAPEVPASVLLDPSEDSGVRYPRRLIR